MKALLVAVGGLITLTAIVSVGLWDVPGRIIVPGALAATILAVALCGVAIRRAWSRRSELPLSVIFYAWLYVVPFLLGVGLLRRALAGTIVSSIEESVAYAERTDLFLASGFVLNALLPLGGLLGAMLFQPRRRRPFAGAIGGAILLFLLVGAVAVVVQAPLFGERTLIEKP